MSNPLPQLGNLGYDTMYVVPVVFMYLLSVEGGFIPYVNDKVIASVLLILSLYGAIWMNEVALLIFGDADGMRSRKKQSVINAHAAYFITGTPPESLPKSESIFEILMEAVFSDHFSLEAFLRAIPGALFYLYLYIALVWLTWSIYTTKITILSGILWIVLMILAFKNTITDYLPAYIPPDSTENLDEAEYRSAHKTAAKNMSSENRGRIDQRRGDGVPSSRYRT